MNNKCKKCDVKLKRHATATSIEPYFDPICRFKARSEDARDELNSKLSQLGLGRGRVNNNCDLIDSGDQNKCPEFEQI